MRSLSESTCREGKLSYCSKATFGLHVCWRGCAHAQSNDTFHLLQPCPYFSWWGHSTNEDHVDKYISSNKNKKILHSVFFLLMEKCWQLLCTLLKVMIITASTSRKIYICHLHYDAVVNRLSGWLSHTLFPKTVK